MPVFFLEHTSKKKRKRLEIDKDQILVGRTPVAEIPLADPSVSKNHLLIERTPGGFSFQDLGSRNGTFLNSERVDRGTLQNDDVLVVGRIRITVRLDSSSSAPGASGESATDDTDASSDADFLGETQGAPTAIVPAGVDAPSTAPGASDARPADLTATASSPPPPVARPATTAGSPPPSIGPGSTRRSEPARGLRTVAVAVVLFLCVVGIGVGILVGVQLATSHRTISPPPDEREIPVVRGESSPALSAPSPASEAPVSEATSAETGAIAEVVPERIEIPGGEFPRGHAPARRDLPGLVDNPLGPYASGEESERVLFRMFLDRLGRPPTRAEVRELLPTGHEERWRKIDELSRASRPTAGGIARTFATFLDRHPTPQELDALETWIDDDFEDLGLWLTATEEYRAANRLRPRDLQQLAGSLIVDLQDRIPTLEEERQLIEQALLELEDSTEVIRVLARTGPIGTSDEQELPAWIRAETFRFLQRFPDADETGRLVEILRGDPTRKRWFRQVLAASKRYRSY